ncbi:hypothetical protein [Streptomyces sp. FxanaA7]|uniref:hypothetical protein n=1 Tax=Streptomyces sp. FxanaA7 TaxID=1265492 RepID=UPI0005EF927E|nr:hypothetical protein [Streptomyces sp. FxanaA7]
MDLNRTPSEIASEAAEQVRALNHRTLDTKVFAQPGDVSDVANGITTLLERLPQTLEQLEAGLTQLHHDGRIRLDAKPLAETSQQDILHEVVTVTSALSEARRLLRQAHEAMREAAGPASHMGGLWEDADDEE